jgi:hypothetical protein
MIDMADSASQRQLARAAGAFYLLTIVTGVFAEVFVRGTLVVHGNAVATANNIMEGISLYRLGLIADLVMMASYIVVTILFHALFKPVSGTVSMLAVGFSLVGIAVLAVNSLNHAAPLMLLEAGPGLSPFGSVPSSALVLLCLKLHGLGYTISGVFFGIYCILMGYLIHRCGFLPRALGVLMAFGGLGLLANSCMVVLSPLLTARLPDMTMVGGIAELTLALWLVIRGRSDNGPKR